jgi:hypothetical protein
VGNGLRDISDSVNYIDPIYPEEEEEDEIDEFEAVGAEKTNEPTTTNATE